MNKNEKIFAVILAALCVVVISVAVFQSKHNARQAASEQEIQELAESDFAFTYLSRDFVSDIDALRDPVSGEFDSDFYKDEAGTYGMLPYFDYEASDLVELADYKSIPIEVPEKKEVTEAAVNNEAAYNWMLLVDDLTVYDGNVESYDVVDLTVSVKDLTDGRDAVYADIYNHDSDDPGEVSMFLYHQGYYGTDGIEGAICKYIDSESVPVNGKFDVVFTTNSIDDSGSEEGGHPVELQAHCEITQVMRSVPMTDESVADVFNGEISTVDEFLAEIRRQLELEAYSDYLEAGISAIESSVVSQCTVKDVPAGLFDWYVSVRLAQYEELAHESLTTDVDGYIKDALGVGSISEAIAVFRNDVYENHTLDVDIVLRAIAEKESIDISESARMDMIGRLAEELGYANSQELIDASGESFIHRYAATRIVYEWLLENGNVVSAS